MLKGQIELTEDDDASRHTELVMRVTASPSSCRRPRARTRPSGRWKRASPRRSSGAGPRRVGRAVPVRPRPRPHRPAVPGVGHRATWSCWLAVSAGRLLAARPRRHQGPLRRERSSSRRRDDEDEDEEARSRSRPRASARRTCRTGTSTASTCATSTTTSRTSRRSGASPRSAGSAAKPSREASSSPAMVQLGLSLEGRDDGAATGAFTPEQLLAAAGPALVPGDRLQPLHELHGVHRLLPVRRLRRGLARPDPGREPGQLQEGLPGVQPGLPRARDHVPRVQDAGHRRRAGRRRQRAEDRPDASCSAATRRDALAPRCRSATASWSATAATRSAWRSASRSGRRTRPQGPKDDLDKLIDALDDLDSLGALYVIRALLATALRRRLPHRPRRPARRARARRPLGRRAVHLRPVHRDRGHGPSPRQPASSTATDHRRAA